jgi:very-short-patch-repair endonuclease
MTLRETPRAYACGLRHRQTDAERRLWAHLRDRRLLGAKFTRQLPIGAYVVDFCCRERKLIVELDGGQHAARAEYDAARTAWLEGLGYRVLRFWDNEALGNTDGVLQRIAEALNPALGRPSPRPSPRRGEGEGRRRRAPGRGAGEGLNRRKGGGAPEVGNEEAEESPVSEPWRRQSLAPGRGRG